MAMTRTTGRTASAQALRAEQVIAAARELAHEGGYEAVQMREVSHRAGVALATLYRYYRSKDELIAAVVMSELDRLREDVLARPPRHRTPAARAAAVFVRAAHALMRDRGYAHAALSSYQVPKPLTDEPGTPRRRRDGSELPPFIESAALGAWGPGHRPTSEQVQALSVLEALWSNSMVRWLNGEISADYLEQRLRFAACRLLGSAEAPRSRAGP